VLHGLSLRAAPNGRLPHATNHGGRESIEVFELTRPRARRRGSAVSHARQDAGKQRRLVQRLAIATVLIMPGKTFEDAFAGRITGAVPLTPGGVVPAVSGPNSLPTTASNVPDDKSFCRVDDNEKDRGVFAQRYEQATSHGSAERVRA
jgi:hypothetical protein